MVKIRLMRIGAKKRPFYRIVAIDERKQRNGAYLDLIGTYNPLTEPKDIKIDQTKLDSWVKKGAVLSDGFLRITGKAPQRPPRKPKKAPKEAAAPKPQAEEATPEKTDENTPQVAEEVKIDADSQLSEAGEVVTESTSSDVHEADQAGSEQSEEAELESPVQSSDEAPVEVTEPTPEAEAEPEVEK